MDAGSRELTLPFVTFDVFTQTRWAGNPLAIVELSEQAAGQLTQDQKQKIAREFNLSETVFLHLPAHAETKGKPPKREWVVNIFTTDEELPFAGHPTIGTAIRVLAEYGDVEHDDGTSRERSQHIAGALLTKAGRIEIQYDRASHLAEALIPHNLHVHSQLMGKAALQRMMPGTFERCSKFDAWLPERSPLVSIVKGMTFILVELADLEQLRAISPNSQSISAELDEAWAPSFVGVYFYVQTSAVSERPREIQARMISNVLEDPATGSAASSLAAYIAVKEGVSNTTSTFRITQGVELGRRSEITIKLSLGDQGRLETLRLVGSAVPVMKGSITM